MTDTMVDTDEGLIDLSDPLYFQLVRRVYFRCRNVGDALLLYLAARRFHEGRILGSSALGGWLAGG